MTYYRYTGGLLITEGIKHFAETNQCFWLLDVIASYQRQCNKDEMLREFQIWTVEAKATRTYKNQVKVICSRDTDDDAFFQKIRFSDITDYTELPIKIYVIDNVILLPSEY
ncbi:DUF6876 family protein [Bernardetia sp. Wsw4-3y2]|uniref:DUF6876 family protein n=1 Tax=Bernardetia sp. Wsw4-3y2 TaxID=3127471 RepID=UPI0030CB15B7